ncbi:MAG: Trk system potassium transporter TrkA [Clostridia bacterium]|nr:Trk system potassium transporter TrkA [Clostridia bacterium]
MFGKKKEEKRGLRIIIVGCGKVGRTLVEQLSQEGHDITIVDRDGQKAQALANLYDIMGVQGNGASYGVLKEAGIETADLLIAVTQSDELNLLCCTVGKQVANCAAIARVRTPDYSREVGYLREKLGLAMIINPEMEAAAEAARILYLPTALEIDSFAHGQADLIKFKVPEGNVLDGMNLITLGQRIAPDILICAAERDGQVIIPRGQYTIRAGDILSFAASRAVGKKFLEDIGFKTNRVRNAMLIGGGRAAYYLARQLLSMGIQVKIIEISRERCEELSILLPKAVIINGDGTNEDLLREEGIERDEAVVALTGIDEENILLTLFARRVSQAKTITKINRITFQDVINSLDLGSVIYPKYITSEAIIRYVRAMKESMDSNIETLYHMFDHRAEAVEFRVDAPSGVTDIPLKDLQLKDSLLVCAIYRDGKVRIPNGQDAIRVGDTIMVVTTHTGFSDIRDILA